eukprot:jgi/Mesvir1/16845/Mv15736-RA.3
MPSQEKVTGKGNLDGEMSKRGRRSRAVHNDDMIDLSQSTGRSPLVPSSLLQGRDTWSIPFLPSPLRCEEAICGPTEADGRGLATLHRPSKLQKLVPADSRPGHCATNEPRIHSTATNRNAPATNGNDTATNGNETLSRVLSQGIPSRSPGDDSSIDSLANTPDNKLMSSWAAAPLASGLSLPFTSLPLMTPPRMYDPTGATPLPACAAAGPALMAEPGWPQGAAGAHVAGAEDRAVASCDSAAALGKPDVNSGGMAASSQSRASVADAMRAASHGSGSSIDAVAEGRPCAGLDSADATPLPSLDGTPSPMGKGHGGMVHGVTTPPLTASPSGALRRDSADAIVESGDDFAMFGQFSLPDHPFELGSVGHHHRRPSLAGRGAGHGSSNGGAAGVSRHGYNPRESLAWSDAFLDHDGDELLSDVRMSMDALGAQDLRLAQQQRLQRGEDASSARDTNSIPRSLPLGISSPARTAPSIELPKHAHPSSSSSNPSCDNASLTGRRLTLSPNRRNGPNRRVSLAPRLATQPEEDPLPDSIAPASLPSARVQLLPFPLASPPSHEPQTDKTTPEPQNQKKTLSPCGIPPLPSSIIHHPSSIQANSEHAHRPATSDQHTLPVHSSHPPRCETATGGSAPPPPVPLPSQPPCSGPSATTSHPSHRVKPGVLAPRDANIPNPADQTLGPGHPVKKPHITPSSASLAVSGAAQACVAEHPFSSVSSPSSSAVAAASFLLAPASGTTVSVAPLHDGHIPIRGASTVAPMRSTTSAGGSVAFFSCGAHGGVVVGGVVRPQSLSPERGAGGSSKGKEAASPEGEYLQLGPHLKPLRIPNRERKPRPLVASRAATGAAAAATVTSALVAPVAACMAGHGPESKAEMRGTVTSAGTYVPDMSTFSKDLGVVVSAGAPGGGMASRASEHLEAATGEELEFVPGEAVDLSEAAVEASWRAAEKNGRTSAVTSARSSTVAKDSVVIIKDADDPYSEARLLELMANEEKAFAGGSSKIMTSPEARAKEERRRSKWSPVSGPG